MGWDREGVATAVAFAIFGFVVPYGITRLMDDLSPAVAWPLIGFSVVFAVLVLLWGFTPHHFNDWRKKMAPVVVMVVGFAIYGAGAFWFYRVHSITSEPSADTTAPKLHIICVNTQLPTEIPPNGYFYVASLHSNGSTGLATTAGSPGASTGLDIENGYTCRITNFTGAPIFNSRLTLMVSWNRFRGETNIQKFQIEVARIDAGREAPFVFYLMNLDDIAAEVEVVSNPGIEIVENEKRSYLLAVEGSPFIVMPLRHYRRIEPATPNAAPRPHAPAPRIDNRGGIFNAAPNSGTQTVINATPQPRILDDALKQKFLAQIPTGKSVTIGCDMGDREAMNYASSIWSFLKSNGYDVGADIIQYTVPAEQPLVINWNGGSAEAPVQITVGKNG